MEAVEWFELPSTAFGSKGEEVPKWARMVARDAAGVVYVTGAAVGEHTAFLCAGYDGTPAILHDEHAYYPAEWMAKEFPQLAVGMQCVQEALAEQHPMTAEVKPVDGSAADG
ncbi:MAG TPA: hypothetical protein VHY82_16010 [Acetobacteraceae bacterium]|jgi:hypothetical protein|nr:hypothetical protein [Acetobacteraceae bacterium]